VDKNLNAAIKFLAADAESEHDIRAVHLGTTSVYGYGTAGTKILEGCLKVKVDRQDGELLQNEIPYPANPGGIYHLTKTQDELLFFLCNKNKCAQTTDHYGGIVWGTQTRERLDDELINRFDDNGDYDTALHRFLIQAAIAYSPSMHSTQGQIRAFIHIKDTVRCTQLASENVPTLGDRGSGTEQRS